MDLYLDNVPVKGDLFKLAAFAARVSEKPENWPQELTSEIMRQLPYLSDYDLNVNLQTVDPQRGFAFGYGDVSSKSERPEVEHAETGIPHIRVPLIIQDRAVKPFNVFLDGERVVPLTEERVRQTLFNPQSFDLSSSAPRDPSLVEALMPPTRTGPGMGGEYKMASAHIPEHIKEEALRRATDDVVPWLKPFERNAPIVAGGLGAAHMALRTPPGHRGKWALIGGLGTSGGAYLGAKAGRYLGTNAQKKIMSNPHAHKNPKFVKAYNKHLKELLKTSSVDKEAFAHITAEQWKAMYENPKVKKLIEKNGGNAKAKEVDNAVYEVAAKLYGYHPKTASVNDYLYKLAMSGTAMAGAVTSAMHGPKAATALQRSQRVLGKLEQRVQRGVQQGRGAGIAALENKLPVSEAVQKAGMPGRPAAQQALPNTAVARPPVPQQQTAIVKPPVQQPQQNTVATRPPVAPVQGQQRVQPPQPAQAPQQPVDRSTGTFSKIQNGLGMAANGATALQAVRGIVPQRQPQQQQQEDVFQPMGTGKIRLAHVLNEIAHTIRKEDADRFVEKIASDPNLVAGFRRSGVAGELVAIFDGIQNQSPEDALLKVASSIVPTVATFLKLPGGDFIVKTAATDAFAGGPQAQGQVVPQEEAAEAIGQENAQAMVPGQSATAVANPAQQEQPVETDDKVVDEFGQWLVQDTMGNRLTGWVFPKTLAWDGSFSPQPIALFTNGSAYAFQDQIAGELAGKSTTLPSDPPRGDGCFYCTLGGKAVATQPVTIGSSMAGPDGLPVFIGTDSFGQQLKVSMSEGLKEPTRVGDVEYALPDHWKFMRLNNQTQLVPDPVQMNKAASVRAEANSVELLYNGAYHLRGACGLNKIAAEFRHDLDPVSAEFMLGVLGVDGISAKTKVAEARRKGIVKIAGLHTITTLGERYSEKVKAASAILADCPDLRVDLIKEAAELDDASSVNNVLSLNFINPENLHMFINYIPELELTSERLAEMWLYSVMGMNELPEDHLERAMKNMENVIEGLKSIAHAEA